MRSPLSPPRRLLASLLVVPLLTVGIVACGGDGEPQTPAEGEKVGGTVACTPGAIGEGVDAWAKTDGGGEAATLPKGSGAFECGNGWAVAFPEVGSGGEAVTVTVVLEAEGQFWIPKDRAKVCGSGPGNAKVPKPLYRDACQTN